MLFASRRRRKGPDRFLGLKIAMLAVAAGLLLFGIRLERSWLVWAAIAVLTVGFALRLLPRGGQPDDTDPDDEH